TLFPKNPTQVTCFSVDVDTQQALDLTDEVFDADKALFESKADYSYCQKIAATARQAGIEAITFRSVRDVRGGGKNTALLTPDAFKGTAPTATHTWYLLLRETGISAASDFPKKSMALSANELNDLMI
ncbi:MAG: RES family NAD+ phosphorylase, partial [Alphaproteobacteria bacterium]